MEPDATGARLVGQLLGYACCCGTPLLLIAGLVWYLLGRPAATGGGAGAALQALGIRLQAPPGAKVQALEGQVRVELASGYVYTLKRGDAGEAIAKRRAWLDSTPHRTQKQVLLAEPDAFIYTAREGELADVSVVAGHGGWVVETHGSIVEHGDLQQQVEAGLSPQQKAALQQAQQELSAAVARGQPLTSPPVQAIMDRIGALTRAGAGPGVKPTKVTSMTVDECRQAVALVRSIAPL